MNKPSESFPPKLDSETAIIAASASLSGEIDLKAGTPALIEMPSAWDAADLTFQTSSNGSTFQDYYDASGNEVVFSVAASRNIKLTAADFAGIRFLKIRSGTAAAPVNQVTQRSIKVVSRVL